jgi:hypothetical protein
MASDTQKPKADTTPKKDVAAKAESAAAKNAPKEPSKETAKEASKETPKDTAKDAAKDAPKADGGETATAAPSNYSRGEGQKPVTAAYKENWNVIFGKKSKKRKKR